MATTVLSKNSSPGAIMLKTLLGKFDALRYLPKLARGVLMFNTAGDLVADSQPSLKLPVTVYTANGAIGLTSGVHAIEKTSAAAMTVAAPATTQDGERLHIISNTDFAHVITFTGSTLLDGTTGANQTVTMTAFKGSSIVVVARNAKWLLENSSNVTSIVV
jgi:ribosomal protein L30E